MNLSRRRFLITTGSLTTFAVAATKSRGAKDSVVRRLACNSWPFRGYFDTPEMHRYRDSKYPLLTQAEFPEFLADQFGIHNVEFLPQHFVDTDPATIEKVRQRLTKANSRCCNLMGVEIRGGVFAEGADRQAMAAEAVRWGKVAVALGSPTITIALSGPGPTDANRAAQNLAPAVDAVHQQGIKVLFHNDNLRLESAETLTALIQALGRERTGACPDFGNFAPKSAAFALEQLRMLAPYASNICHAKDGIAEGGKFYADDFAASMKVMRNAEFQGVYSLEYEGLDDPVSGVRQLMKMVEVHLN